MKKIAMYVIFITVCTMIGVGNYYIYLAIGIWNYVGLSLISSLLCMLSFSYHQRQQKARSQRFAEYRAKELERLQQTLYRMDK